MRSSTGWPRPTRSLAVPPVVFPPTGADLDSGLTRSLGGTASGEADVKQTVYLLHGQEIHDHGDGGYTGADKRRQLKDRRGTWRSAMKRGRLKGKAEGRLNGLTDE